MGFTGLFYHAHVDLVDHAHELGLRRVLDETFDEGVEGPPSPAGPAHLSEEGEYHLHSQHQLHPIQLNHI